jgi:hypothetical protein
MPRPLHQLDHSSLGFEFSPLERVRRATAVIGLLYAAVRLAAAPVSWMAFSSSVRAGTFGQQPSYILPLWIASYSVSAILAVILLAGCVSYLRNRSGGARVMRVWALLACGWVVVGGAATTALAGVVRSTQTASSPAQVFYVVALYIEQWAIAAPFPFVVLILFRQTDNEPQPPV